MNQRQKAAIIMLAFAVSMLGSITFPNVSADGPGDPYYWPVVTGDVLIWEHQQEGGVVTYEKWEFVERNWTELIPGNYSETIWFNVYEWNSTYGTWDRISYLGYPETQPAPICSANWTYQTWDHTGLGDYISGEPYAFVNGLDPVLNGFFIPRHYEFSGEVWSWINQTYFYAFDPAPEINSDPYTGNKLQIYNTSQSNFVVEYFNYTIHESYDPDGYKGRRGALLNDHATIYPNGTIQERMLLRRLIDQNGVVDYSYDAEIPSKASLPWGIKKGDKLIWNNTLSPDSYLKWEIVGFQVNASANREFVIANGFSWATDHYDSIQLSSNLPTQLPQEALAANCTWQSFNLQGNDSHPIWGYPYGLATNSQNALPLQSGTVNMTWFDISFRELVKMSVGAFPAEFSTTINGLTYTVRNTTAGVDVFQYNYTSKGVLSYYVVRNYAGTPMMELVLVRGPGLIVTKPPAPVYSWGIKEGDVVIWKQQGDMIDTYLKSEILGFEDETPAPGFMREIVHDIKFNWDQETSQWDASTGTTSPPDLVQDAIIANLTWQYFEFIAPGSGLWGWGYPYGPAYAPMGMPLMNCLFLPLQSGNVNMSWFSTAYQAFYTFMGVTGCSFAVNGLTFTITNISSSVVREKYIFNALGVMEYYCARNWDDSIGVEIKIVLGPGFPSTPPPATKLSWGVAPRDEIVWGLGLDPESGTILGQMKWNISYIEVLEAPPINFYREAIYANATKYNSASGEWETIVATMSSTPPEVPQPMVWANTTWQLFPWNIAEMTPQYMMGYPFGVVGGFDVPLFNSIPIPIYNEMIVPLQGGNVNMSWIDESWHNLFTALLGVYPPDWQSSIVGNCLKITNTTSTVVQIQMNYTSSGILELFQMRNPDNSLMVNYTLLSAPGWTPPEDITPPSISISSPTPYQVLGNATPGFQVTITDPNLDKTWYKLGGSNFTFTGNSGTFNSAAWAAQGNGTVSITFYANDTLGHQSEVLLTVRKDVIPPTLSITQPTGAYASGLPPDYTLAITEPNLNTIWYTLNNGVSNYTASGPTGTISGAAWGACSAGPVTINFYVNDTGGNWVNASVTVTKFGASMVVNSPVTNAIFGTTAPGYSVTVSSQTGVYYSFNGGVTNYTITLSTTPGTYTGNFDSTAWQNLPNGSLTVTFAVVDASSYWNVINVGIRKDIQAPTITINTPTGQYSSCQPPAFTLTIGEGNLDDIWYSLNNGITNFTCGTGGTIDTNAWRAAGSGGVWITFYSNDSLGNLGVNTVAVMKLVPSLTVGAPATGQWFGPTPPTITVAAMNYQTLGYTFDGVTNFTFASFTTAINTAAWLARPEGVVPIMIYATDSFGNWVGTVVNLYKDATLPTVIIATPTSGSSFPSSAPTFTVGIVDANLVRRWYTLNGGTTEYTFTGASGTIDAAAWAALPNGQITIRFYGSDIAGNVQSSVVVVQKGTTGGGTVPGEFPWLWVVVGLAAGAGAGIVTMFFVMKGKKPGSRRGKSKGFWTNLPSDAPNKKKY